MIVAVSLILVAQVSDAKNDKLNKLEEKNSVKDFKKDVKSDNTEKGNLKFKHNQKTISLSFDKHQTLTDFQTIVEETDNGYKWSYYFRLPSKNYEPKIMVNSETPIKLLEDKYVIINDNKMISFDDVIDYGFTYDVVISDQYNAIVTLSKDWKNYNIGDMIYIDPLITIYPATDGHIRRQDTGAFNIDTASGFFHVGTWNGSGDFLYRAYLTFDTTELDVYDIITNATFSINFTSLAQSDSQEGSIILESIPYYGTLDSGDWNLTGNTTIIAEWINDSDNLSEFYEVDVSGYINKSGLTSFRMKSDYEVYGGNTLRFEFATNETPTSPQLDIYFEDVSPFYGLGNDYTPPNNQVYSPKVACNLDGTLCLSLHYNDYFLAIRQVKLIYSVDSFENAIDTGTHLPATTLLNADLTLRNNTLNLPLPYDLTYNPTNNKFYIVGTVDTANSRTTRVWSWSTVDGLQIEGDLSDNPYDPTPCTSGTTACSYFTVPIGIAFKDADQPIVKVLGGTCWYNSLSTPIGCTGLRYYVQDFYLYNQTHSSTSSDIGDDNGDCWIDGVGGQFFYYLSSSFVEKDEYYIRTYLQCDTGGTLPTVREFSSFTMPTNFSGIQFFRNDYLFYQRNDVDEGIYRVSTTDFSTFGTPELVYDFDQGNNEYVNTTHFTDFQGGIQYVFEFFDDNATWFDPIFGWFRPRAFSFRSNLYPLFVNIQYIDPLTGTGKSDISGLVTLENDAEDWTDSQTGTFNILNSPSLTGNKLRIITDQLIPVSYINLNLDPLCPDGTYISTVYGKPYPLEFVIIDSLTLTTIEDATVMLNAQSCTTDSDGRCSITINPFLTSDLVMTKLGDCNYKLAIESTQRPFTLQVSKTNYLNLVETSQIYVTYNELGNPEYVKQKTHKMIPDATRIIVHLKTQDNIEIMPLTASMQINGSDNITWHLEGQYINISETKTATRFPTDILFFDDSPTLNISLTLNYAGSVYYDSVTLTENEFIDHDFVLPFNSLNVPCETVGDCDDSFCLEDYFYDSVSCDSICLYNTEQCNNAESCDNSKGCFDIKTSDSCSDDDDCEKSCFDDSTMTTSECGLEGLCLESFRECTTFCNQTLNICDEIKDCAYGTSETFKIELSKNTYLYPLGTSGKTIFECGFDNADTKVCLDGFSASKNYMDDNGLTVSNMFPSIANWGYVLNESQSRYNFYPLSIDCSESCGIIATPCANGCNPSNGECLEQAQISQTRGWLELYGLDFLLLPSVLWMILALSISTIITYYVSKESKTNSWQIGAIVMLSLSIIGVYPLGFLNIWIGLVISIATAMLLARELTKHG